MSSYSILNFFPPIKPNTNNYPILKIKKTSNPLCTANNYKLHSNFTNYNKIDNPGWDGTHNDFLFIDNNHI